MGFRSTLTSEHFAIKWPQWFKDKYEGNIFIADDSPLASKIECKTYGLWIDLDADIQRALAEVGFVSPFVLVYLHECGGITRVQIERERIIYSEPRTWEKTKGMTHDYCYGCSDIT